MEQMLYRCIVFREFTIKLQCVVEHTMEGIHSFTPHPWTATSLIKKTDPKVDVGRVGWINGNLSKIWGLILQILKVYFENGLCVCAKGKICFKIRFKIRSNYIYRTGLTIDTI